MVSPLCFDYGDNKLKLLFKIRKIFFNLFRKYFQNFLIISFFPLHKIFNINIFSFFSNFFHIFLKHLPSFKQDHYSLSYVTNLLSSAIFFFYFIIVTTMNCTKLKKIVFDKLQLNSWHRKILKNFRTL